MDPNEPTIRPATEADLPAINRIYNYEILNGVAAWEEEPWSMERRRQWFIDHDETMPVFVAEVDGEVAGMSYLSIYRPRIGYRHTRENTVYVDQAFHRRGIGSLLLGRVIEAAAELNMRVLMAVIEASNEASIELHARLGYQRVGTAHRIGFKFGRWLDSTYMEYTFPALDDDAS
jgi:L-amino acid N-acyltransferase YncA